jgi:hypothetical protein
MPFPITGPLRTHGGSHVCRRTVSGGLCTKVQRYRVESGGADRRSALHWWRTHARGGAFCYDVSCLGQMAPLSQPMTV